MSVQSIGEKKPMRAGWIQLMVLASLASGPSAWALSNPVVCKDLFGGSSRVEKPISAMELMTYTFTGQPRKSGSPKPVLVGKGRDRVSVHVQPQSGEDDVKVFFLDPVLGAERLPPIRLREDKISGVLQAQVNGKDYVVVMGASQFVAPRNENRSFIIDPMTGKVIQEIVLKHRPTSTFLVQKQSSAKLYALANGKLMRVDIPSGEVKKISDLEDLKAQSGWTSSIVGRVKVKGDPAFVIATDKAVHIVDEKSGSILKRYKGDLHVDPVVFERDGENYVVSLDRVPSGGLRVMKLSTGQVQEVALPIQETHFISRVLTLAMKDGKPTVIAVLKRGDHSQLAFLDPDTMGLTFSEPTPLIIDSVVSFQVDGEDRLLAYSHGLVPTRLFPSSSANLGVTAPPGYTHAVDVGYQFNMSGRYLGDLWLPGGAGSAPAFFTEGTNVMMIYSTSLVPAAVTFQLGSGQ